MTPEMNKWARKLGDKIEKYMDHKWFDVTVAALTALAEDDPEKECIEILEKYKLPFDKTVVINSSKATGASIFTALEGDFMEEGLTIDTFFFDPKQNRVVTLEHSTLKNRIVTEADAGRTERFNSFAVFPDGTRVKDDRIGKIIVASIALFYKTLIERSVVSSSPTPINSFTNRRLKAQGKPLHYEWKTIEIGAIQPRRTSLGGTHASPRLHERRGHLRNLKSGKQVWVKSCKVGDASRGTVFHDYVIKEVTA